MKVVAVLRLPKRGPKNGTVFGACGKCANTKRPQKRVRNPDPILAPLFTQFSPLSSEFSYSSNSQQNGGKQASGKLRLPVQIFELARAADQRAGNNNKQQQQSCGCALLNQRLNKILQHRGGSLSAAFGPGPCAGAHELSLNSNVNRWSVGQVM